MREKEEKKEKLKAIVSNIICNNNSILDVISKSNRKFIVTINSDKNSRGSKSNCHVILGTQNLITLSKLCNDFCNKFSLELKIDRNVFNYISNDDIYIETYDLKEEELENIKFLDGEKIGPSEYLSICAIAFTLYHEFGHVMYDDDFIFPIEKERKADIFALDIVKKKFSENPRIKIDQSPYLLGAILDTCLILEVCDPVLTEVSTTHPHPIERLYLMLEYFHIEPNSYLWQFVYDVVVSWINKHHISNTFEKDSSKSLKDKILDAYLRFKK